MTSVASTASSSPDAASASALPLIAPRLAAVAAPIDVVHLAASYDIGGLEMVVLDLVRNADRSRFTPHVVALEGAGTLAPRFAEIGVPVVALQPDGGSPTSGVMALYRYFKRTRPAVVHTHNVKPHLQGTLGAWLAAVPVILNTKHGRNYPVTRTSVLASRVINRRCDCLVAVSADAAEIARTREGFPDDRVRVIRNGIDVQAYRPAGLSTRPEIRTRAIHVARLNAVKDQATLLRAIPKIVAAVPAFTLEIVGDGPERASLEALARELGIAERVHFLGFRDDIPARLAESGLFILSSKSEGVSLTLLEAMAAGLPIVATRVGGNPEVVDEGRSGLLVPSGNPEALADAVIQLMTDPDLASRFGRAGRVRAEREFDVRQVAATYEALYLELLARRGQLTSSAATHAA
jgi:sugar transferase (PEP-CTERM/EpsH1 system associated)